MIRPTSEININQGLDETAFVDFKCPHCGGTVSFPETSIATVQECPTCFQMLIVPARGVSQGTKLPIPFKTPRLLLRRLATGDASDLLELMSDNESFRYID